MCYLSSQLFSYAFFTISPISELPYRRFSHHISDVHLLGASLHRYAPIIRPYNPIRHPCAHCPPPADSPPQPQYALREPGDVEEHVVHGLDDLCERVVAIELRA